MQVPANLTELTKEVILINHYPDETNTPENPETAFQFTWTVTSFDIRAMEIKILFYNAEYMSSGLAYDKLSVSVIDASFFIVDTGPDQEPDYIKSGTTDVTKLPK